MKRFIALLIIGVGVQNFEPLLGIHLDVVDIGDDLEEKNRLLAVSLQGNVNRDSARLYLIWEPSGLLVPRAGQEWLNYYQSKGWITYDTISLDSALSKYCSYINGFVVYDTTFRHSINIAFTIAALETALVAHPDYIDSLENMGLPMIRDLRGIWTNPLDAYQWQYDSLFSQCSKKLLGQKNVVWVDPLNPCGHLLRHSIRDYLVAERAVNIGLSTKPWDTLQYQLVEKYYQQIDTFGLVFGLNPADTGNLEEEPFFVKLTSEHGLLEMADWDAGNITVHSRMPADTMYSQSHIDTVELDTTKVYCAFLWSDGCSPAGVIQGNTFSQWFSPIRGTMPITWAIGTHRELYSGCLQYFYETMTPNDYLIGWYAYIHPTYFSNLEAYLTQAKPALEACDIKIVPIMNFFHWDDAVADIISEQLSDGIGFTMDYGNPAIRQPEYRFYQGKPWVTFICNCTDSLQSEIEHFVASHPQRPLFLPILLGVPFEIRLPQVKTVYDNLNNLYPGVYKFVKYDELLKAIDLYQVMFDSTHYLPDSITLVKGTITNGNCSSLFSNDNNYLEITSEWDGGLHCDITSYYATVHIAQSESIVGRLWANYESHLSGNYITILYIFNYKNANWERIGYRYADTVDYFEQDGVVYNAWDYIDNNEVNIMVTSLGLNNLYDSVSTPFISYSDYLNLSVFYRKEQGVIDNKNSGTVSFAIFPNPIMAAPSIKYSIPIDSYVGLKIYNLAGQLVKTLVNKPQKAGSYAIKWDGTDNSGKFMPNGIYFIKLKIGGAETPETSSGSTSQTKKLLLLR